MSEQAEQPNDPLPSTEDVLNTDQSLTKQLQELRREMKLLQSGELLANVESEREQITAKYGDAFAEYDRLMAEHEQRLHERQKGLPIDYETLPFRKSLEDQPDLVEYIKQNLPWLRLIVLLYGGISDQGLATYAIQYDEISALLQLENTLRLYRLAQLRERNYWQESWDSSDDTIYSLAVFLDTEGGQLAKKAAAYIPEFTPSAIFNDSPLTSIVLNALQQKKQPSTLKHRLWQEWQSTNYELRRVHALLALLLIDTQQAVNTLAQCLHSPTTSALAELVLNQLRLRKYTLADALILLGKRAEIGPSLEPLRAVLGDDQWGDMVELFFRTFASVMPVPVKYDNVLLSCAGVLPRINAEIWLYWLSGFGSDDVVYNYAVILDTIGKKIKSASALTNIQFAHNRKYDDLTQWYQPAIPPVYDNYADTVGEALTIAHRSHSETMKDLFYPGTMIYTGANSQESYGLKEDTLAAVLLIPPEFQKGVIEQLDAELAQASPYILLNQIIERVLALTDPVIKARALWRIAQRYGFDYAIWRNLNLWDLAIRAAEQINDPLHRSRAFERLINHISQRQGEELFYRPRVLDRLINRVPQKLSERIKDEALRAARTIGDPNNRARALARLALYESNEKRWSLLAEALTAVGRILDERQRVETLQLLYPYLSESAPLTQTYDKIRKNLKSDWYRDKERNLLSLRLLAFHDQLHEPHKLTPVILAALIDEMLALKPQQAQREDLWSRLLEPTQREQTLSALLKAAAANDLDGLYLTPKAFNVIQSLLNLEEIAAIYTLLPYLRGVEPSLLPELNRWMSQAPDEIVRAYAGLFLAEAGKVNAKTIPCLIELIKNGCDLGRYRASIVLHGSSIFVQKKNREFRTSQLGLSSLLLLGQAYEQLRTERIQSATPLAWTWHNIIHDDPLVLRQLVEQANPEKGTEDSALHLLRFISYCDDSCLDQLIQQFEEGTEKIQEALLYSWFMLLDHHFKENITSEQQKRMEEAASKLPIKVLEGIKVIPERLRTVTSLLTSVGQQIENKEITWQQAIPLLNQKLSVLSWKLPETELEAFGKHTLYKVESDPSQALEAAQTISESGTSLELLFAWLAASLRESMQDTPVYYHRTSTLLELAGNTTHFSPAAIYNLIEKHEMGHLLMQATMYQGSFWGRAGAVTLLAYLRHTTEAFEEALLCGLGDVAIVQSATIQMAQKLRYLDERMITRMISLLEDENASVVYTVATLLANIARNNNSSYTIRQMIVQSLNKAIQRIDSTRPVFLLKEAGTRVFIRNMGRLDHQLYAAIINIINIL